MSKNYLKEACKLSLSISWTDELMRNTLNRIMLDSPAAFIKAVKPPQIKVQIMITGFPREKKIPVLKAFRELTGASLNCAKECIESTFPISVMICTTEKATSNLRLLETAGATVTAIPL